MICVFFLSCSSFFFFFLNTPEAKHDYTNDQLTTEADQLNCSLIEQDVVLWAHSQVLSDAVHVGEDVVSVDESCS